MLPRIPRKVSLRLARHQTPVDRTNVVPLGNWQDRLNGTALRAGHVFGAQDRSPVRGELADTGLERRRPGVGVKADHVGLVNLLLRPTRMKLFDLGNTLSLQGPTGRVEIVEGLAHVWAAADRLSPDLVDPLDIEQLEIIEST